MSISNPLLNGKNGKPRGDFHLSFVENNSIVLCKVFGYMSKATIQKMLDQCKLYTNTLAAQGKPTLLAFDISQVKGSSADARSAINVLGNYRTDRCAVFGRSSLMMLLAQYVIRLTGRSNTRTFSTRRSAFNWLQGRHHGGRVRLARTIAVSTIFLGLVVLLGWLTDISGMRRLNPFSDPVSPIVAVSFIIAGVSLVCLTLKRNIYRVIAGAGALCITLFSLVVLGRWIFGINFPFDSRLGIPQTSHMTAIVLAFLGISILVACKDLNPRKLLGKVFRGTVVVAAIAPMVGFVYNNLSSVHLVIPSEHLILFAAIVALSFVVREGKVRFPVARWLVARYSQGLVVFVILFVATFFLWQQTKLREERDLFLRSVDIMNAQIATDFDILRDYRAFYNASSSMGVEEFGRYFSELNIQKRYSGITHVGFLRNQSTNQKIFYPLTYVTPYQKNANYGLNFAQNANNLKILETARDTGRLTAIGSTASNFLNKEGRREVLVVAAMYTPGNAEPTTVAERRQQLYGFVVAEFDYDVFFQNFFREFSETKYTALIISDPQDSDRLLYQSPMVAATTNRTPIQTRTLTIAEHSWRVSLLPKNFKFTDLWHGSGLILVEGLTISLLVALLTVSLIRRRYQALSLAEEITADLEFERNRAVEAAQRNETILANVGDGLVVTDADGKVLRVNDKFCEIFRFAEKDIEGKSFIEAVKAIDKDGKPVSTPQRYLYRALKYNRRIIVSMSEESKYRRGDGTYFSVAGSFTPINNNDKLIGVVGVIRDVSAEAKVDKAKTEFVSLASHQLRTPLTAAKWYSELLLQGEGGKLNTEQRAYVRQVFAATNRTIKLVSAFLNLSRIDTGSVAIEPEPTNLPTLAHDIVHELAKQISARKLKVHEEFKPESFEMNIDPRLVRIMIENLMTNAIKYTPESGSITLNVSKHKKGLFIKVSDTGYGIPEDQQARIFTKLFRADNIQKRSVEGVGLGLYLVKSIVEYLGGTISFKSVENKGTTFYIQLPPRGMKSKPGKQII